MKEEKNWTLDECKDLMEIWRSLYSERTEDVFALGNALKTIYSIAGEDENIKKIVIEALDEHGL